MGDPGCLLALARGLAADRAERRLDGTSLDASLTALALASRKGNAMERIVACLEVLLVLPDGIGGERLSRTRRALGLSCLFQTYRALHWSLSRRGGEDLQCSVGVMMQAFAAVEADSIRRGLFHAGIDRNKLLEQATDLVSAQPPSQDSTSAQPNRNARDHTSDAEDGVIPGADPSRATDEDTGSYLVPFPRFDPNRLADSRNPLATRYAGLGERLPLTTAPSRDVSDKTLRALAIEMPNFRSVVERIGDEVALARCIGLQAPLRLPLLLLAGPPGVGKTRFCRRLAECLGLGFGFLALAGSSDSRELSGTARGWSSAHPAWPVEQLVILGTGNPLLLADEIDKAGGSEPNGRAIHTLLTRLEPATSGIYYDECLDGPIDLSFINWVLSANTTEHLPAPLLSRLIVLPVEPPEADQASVLLETMRRDVAVERHLADARLLPVLPQGVVVRLSNGYAGHRDPRRLRAELVRALASAARAEECRTGNSAPVLN